jgi:hypothetical protein
MGLNQWFHRRRECLFPVPPRFVLRLGSVIVSIFGPDLVFVSESGFDSAF